MPVRNFVHARPPAKRSTHLSHLNNHCRDILWGVLVNDQAWAPCRKWHNRWHCIEGSADATPRSLLLTLCRECLCFSGPVQLRAVPSASDPYHNDPPRHATSCHSGPQEVSNSNRGAKILHRMRVHGLHEPVGRILGAVARGSHPLGVKEGLPFTTSTAPPQPLKRQG